MAHFKVMVGEIGDISDKIWECEFNSPLSRQCPFEGCYE